MLGFVQNSIAGIGWVSRLAVNPGGILYTLILCRENMIDVLGTASRRDSRIFVGYKVAQPADWLKTNDPHDLPGSAQLPRVEGWFAHVLREDSYRFFR